MTGLAIACPTCSAQPEEPCFGWHVEMGAFTELLLPHRERLAALEERNRQTGTIR